MPLVSTRVGIIRTKTRSRASRRLPCPAIRLFPAIRFPAIQWCCDPPNPGIRRRRLSATPAACPAPSVRQKARSWALRRSILDRCGGRSLELVGCRMRRSPPLASRKQCPPCAARQCTGDPSAAKTPLPSSPSSWPRVAWPLWHRGDCESGV